MRYSANTMRMQRLRRAAISLAHLVPYAALGLGFAFVCNRFNVSAAIVEIALAGAVAAFAIMRLTDYHMQFPFLRSYRSSAALTFAGVMLYITVFQLASPPDISTVGRDAIILLLIGAYGLSQAALGGWSGFLNCGDDPQWRDALSAIQDGPRGTRDVWLVSYGDDRQATVEYLRSQMADIVLPSTRMSLPVLLAVDRNDSEAQRLTQELRRFGATLRTVETGSELALRQYEPIQVVAGESAPLRVPSRLN